jgi:hypothetical protein
MCLPIGPLFEWARTLARHTLSGSSGDPVAPACTVPQDPAWVEGAVVKRYGLVATTAMRLYRLWCPFGEVEQDLLLSCLTIG